MPRKKVIELATSDAPLSASETDTSAEPAVATPKKRAGRPPKSVPTGEPVAMASVAEPSAPAKPARKKSTAKAAKPELSDAEPASEQPLEANSARAIEEDGSVIPAHASDAVLDEAPDGVSVASQTETVPEAPTSAKPTPKRLGSKKSKTAKVVDPVAVTASEATNEESPVGQPSSEPEAVDVDFGDLAPVFRKRNSQPTPDDQIVLTFRPRKGQAPIDDHRGEELEAIEPAQLQPIELDSAGFELPMPTWRPRTQAVGKTSKVHADPAPDADEAGERRSRNGRNRRRRGRSGDSAEASAEVAVQDDIEIVEVTEAKEPAAKMEPVRIEPPKVISKPGIPTPEDAPQIHLRNGLPTLVREHRVYPSLVFFGSAPDERRAETVFEELRMAADAGIHLHSHLIDFEVDPKSVDASVALAAYMLKRSVEIDPQAQVVFRIIFQAPTNWHEKYPKGRYRSADGTPAEPSVCDDEFWSVAQECLVQFVKKMRMLDLRKHLLGLHLDRGEWFLGEGWGYDSSPAAQQKFRDWARMRYQNDEVTLHASWFDGSARFDTIQLPPYEPGGAEGDKFIRSSRKQRRYVDYHLFLSDATVQRIGELAYATKEASEGYCLVGVSYGYTFEWSHPASCHLSLGKLLRTPEIDFIAGPPSYRTREPGGSATFPGPIDSFALNGKLYLSEEDFKTSLAQAQEPDDFNPPMRTPQALESVHWRGAGSALAHGSGVVWMDLWGNGWLKTGSVWARAASVRKALTTRMGGSASDPEVAIFIDERALAYLVDSDAFQLLVQNVRESVMRAGVSAAFYLLSDLAHREVFPESKLYIFVNAWDIRPELRAAIKSRLQRDNKVLFWLYAAGMFDAGRDSLERAREVTGIALKPQPFYSKAGTTILNRRHPLAEAFPDRSLVGGTKLEPSYFAIPENALVLGEYTQTGLPSFVVKDFKEGEKETHWTSVFLGEPRVTPALIRALAQMAGAHVWNFHEDVVHLRPPFCTVHCTGAGPRTLALPDKFAAYNLLTNEWANVEGTSLRFTALDGSTHVFLVGPRIEIEHLLSINTDEVLRMEEYPQPESNVREDGLAFDVPIMKLDEWIGGNESDEVADEWFLRAPEISEEPQTATEAPEVVGRRRRRRGGREDRGGRPEASSFADEALSMNVMFRKLD